MIRTATVEGHYRYDLRRVWGSGRTLTVMGLNPSNANALMDDATIRVLVNYSKRLGMQGLLMLNLYAWIATRPSDLIKASKNGKDVIGEFNSFDLIKRKITQSDSPYVFAAWGVYGLQRGKEFARFMGREWCMHNLKYFAGNNDGSPHHPLRLHFHDAIHPYYSEAWFQ